MRRKEVRPAAVARGAAWCIAFLLTVALTVTVLLGPAAVNRVFTDENLHIQTATDDAIIREQMDKVAGVIRELAEDYSFDAEAVAGTLTREEFAAINEETARWWTRIVSEGIMDEIPEWKADGRITDAIEASLDRKKYRDEQEREEVVKGIAGDIEKAVGRTVMPFRKALIKMAVRYISRRADLPGVIRFLAQIPLICLLVSVLLAGMIALLVGKRIRWSLKYYGAAFAGAGISAMAGIFLVRNADIGGMIRTASEGLSHQAQTTLREIVLETWGVAGILFIIGMACLIRYIRQPGGRRKHGGEYEAKEDDSQDPVAQNQEAAAAGRRRRSAQRAV